MTPAERLLAAIVKLEQLKVEAPPAPWDTKGGVSSMRMIWGDAWTEHEFQIAQAEEVATCELILTLHRTIDAQLAWLRDQSVRLAADVAADTIGDQELHYRHALALADAILGGDQ